MARYPQYYQIDAFCSYDALKKSIYQLEKQHHDQRRSSVDVEGGERQQLIPGHDRSETDALFVPLLDRELRKMTFFYDTQEKELLEGVSDLEQLVKEQEESGLTAESYFDEASDEEDDDDDPQSAAPRSPVESRPPRRQRRRSSAGAHHVGGASPPLYQTVATTHTFE